MFDPTVSFHLDMVALEAGMTMYELENGITDEYLRAVESFTEDSEEAATEGASFMSGLFEDDFVATEGFKETMGKVGKGIKAALITVGGAIKKIFLGLARTIQSAFQALIEKISRAKAKNDPWVAKILAKDPSGQLQKMTNAISKTFATAASTVAAASQVIMPIVKKINSALNKAAIGNSKKANAYNEDDVSNVGKNYIKSNQLKNRNDDMGYERTENEIAAAKEQIKKLEEMYTELDGAVGMVNESAKGMDTLASSLKDAGVDAKAPGLKTNGKGEEKDTLIKKAPNKKMLISALLSGVNAAPINSVAKRVTTECSVHAKACDNIVKQATGLDGGTEANTGYRLCKIYLDASKIFSKISLVCNKVFIFKVSDLSDESMANADKYAEQFANGDDVYVN